MAPKEAITSVTLLEGAKEYKFLVLLSGWKRLRQRLGLSRSMDRGK